ncbi:HCP-like superfamily protein with MYND-type zinc finger [Prunus dulcis]|uniref:HCP-like superfamily protein with MYND-type zinc finger n=1 Tax=Prunus dulcis TaxID=3755 RepID=A0A4Y1RH75_PRUDU|nr:HCP-like superfamily protein with MYND-type zinc finger [Prunus dulcis]
MIHPEGLGFVFYHDADKEKQPERFADSLPYPTREISKQTTTHTQRLTQSLEYEKNLTKKKKIRQATHDDDDAAQKKAQKLAKNHFQVRFLRWLTGRSRRLHPLQAQLLRLFTVRSHQHPHHIESLGASLCGIIQSRSQSICYQSQNWSDSAHRFLKQCVSAGNIEACYTLGMIRFYSLQNRGSGASLMAKAAMRSHAPALYSLAVVQFNGSGGSKKEKDLRAGVALCARAASLGHVDALRELGHCLQDGYGVKQNVAEGRRLLVQANARELASVLRSATWRSHHYQHLYACLTGLVSCPLLSDFGCNVPAPELHPANRFLKEWFGSGRAISGQGMRLCSHVGCGRPETRPHEFRRCSVCGTVNYCSRGCQALDWKLRHKVKCKPIERWLGVDGELGDWWRVEMVRMWPFDNEY